MNYYNALAINEESTAYVEFVTFLDGEIDAWVKNTYDKIIADVNGIDNEQGLTVVRQVKVDEHNGYSADIGRKLLFENLEVFSGSMNMYWNGKLKLRFNPKVSCYTKNSGVFKSFYMSVSLTNELKTFITKLQIMLEKHEITLVVDATLYNGNGIKTNVYFDTLNEEFNYHADCEFVLRYVSLNLSYVKTFN